MGLFGNWFRARPRDAGGHDTEPGGFGERAVPYDPGLVASLMADHRDLVAMYGQLGQDVREGNYHRIPNALLAFRTRLEAHVLLENVRFYAYVERSMAHDGARIAAARNIRREMDPLARGVAEFAARHQQVRVDGDNVGEFMREYDQIGRLLVERIQHEEGSLYPLYGP